MLIADRLLRELCKSIEPSPAQKTAASRSHTWLKQRLNTGNMAGCCLNSFLIGSYVRKTAIAPIDDVDVVMVVEPTFWDYPFWKNYPDPEQVIKTFHKAIKYRYPTSGVRRQKRSVGLKLSRLNIDVVPAIETAEENVLLIPDREAQDWIRTAPKIHNRRISEINKQRSGLLVPLVKLIKFWNGQLPYASQMKSFAIETMAARLFSHYPLESLSEGMLRFFDFIVYASSDFWKPATIYTWPNNCGVSLGSFGAVAKDITGINSNTLDGISYEQRERFCEKAKQTRDWLIAIKDRPTETNTIKQLEKVMKVEFRITAEG